MKRWFPLWTIPTLIIFSIGTVWVRLSIVRTTYAIHEIDRSIEKYRQERDQLQLKVAALRSPRRLETLAHTKFKLFQPKMEQVVHLGNAEAVVHGHR
jgi:cell division protein FtsL